MGVGQLVDSEWLKRILARQRQPMDERLPNGQSSIMPPTPSWLNRIKPTILQDGSSTVEDSPPLVRRPLSGSMDLTAPTNQPTTDTQPITMPPELMRRVLDNNNAPNTQDDQPPLTRPILNTFAAPSVQSTIQPIQDNQLQRPVFTRQLQTPAITLSRSADQQDSRQPATDIGIPALFRRIAPQITQSQDAPPVRPSVQDASTIPVLDRSRAIEVAEQNPRGIPGNPDVSYRGGRVVEINSSIPDSESAVPLDARSRVQALNNPIGRIPTTLEGPALYNYVAGAVKQSAEQKLGSPVQAVLMNQSGFRKPSLPAGDVSASSIYEMLPFDDSLVAADVKGSQLQQFVSQNGRGMAMAGDVSNLDPNKTYTVAVPDYVIKRGGSRSLQGATNVRPLGTTSKDAVIDAMRGGQSDQSQPSTPAVSAQPDANSSTQAPLSGRAAAAEQRRTVLEDRLTKLLQLENTPAVDHNGRLKSGLLSALRLGLQGLASGGLAGGAGAALTGFVGGVVHPSLDEHLKQASEILKQRGKLGEALSIEKELSSIDEMQARADAAREKNSPDAQATKTRMQMLGELARRVRIAGGHLNPNDPEQAALMQKLNISAPSGGSFNPQRVKVVRGADGQDRLVYVDYKDGQIAPRYLDVSGNPGATLSERDQKMLAIELEHENRERALDGLPPLKFNDEESAATPPTSLPPSSSTPSATPASTTQPQTQQPISPQSPQATPPSTRPVLVPSGAKAEPVNPVFGRGRRGGRGRS
ncbi:MAG TPA: 5'-nucleotidase C-terminal domain-containing protein, partial [Pyrinomonadaceae bacterium]|nr:5'-nucleotidase C-terminal domain-containing protein [Pyrinomonadaceae bacterium]